MMIHLNGTWPTAEELSIAPDSIASISRTAKGETQVSLRNGQLFNVVESIADVVSLVVLHDRQAQLPANADGFGFRR